MLNSDSACGNRLWFMCFFFVVLPEEGGCRSVRRERERERRMVDERAVKGKTDRVPALQQHVHPIGFFEIQMRTVEDLISTQSQHTP